MTTTRPRWPLPAAAAAVLLAVLALATCRSDESAPAPLAEKPSAPERAQTPRKSRRGAETSGPSKAARGSASTTPAAPEGGSVPEDEGFPFVDVEVVRHDGSPASNAAVVYALPAGATTTIEPPNENLEFGRCRLHVLRPGKYDVGAVDDAFAALAEDVEIPHDGELKITLPEPAKVLLVGDPPLVPDVPDWGGAKVHLFADGERLASWPGRGQRIDWMVGEFVEQGTKRIDFSVPKGSPGRVKFASGDVDAMPGTFSAPATLRLVRARRYPLTLRLAFESPGASFPHATVLRAEFRVGDVGTPTAVWSAWLAANQTIGTLFARPIELRADANEADGTITWKGDGIAPGSQPFGGLAAGAENVADVTLRLAAEAQRDGSGEVPRPRFSTTIALRAAPGDDAALPSKVRLFLVNDRGDRSSTEHDPGEDISTTGPDRSWLVAARGSWASDGARPVSGADNTATTLTLRPGGWLVLAPERRPPRSLGPVTIRRKDGAPLLTQDGASVQFAADVESGAVLGPIPAGGVDFVLALSGEDVREVRATVRDGARDKLVIPSLAPR